MSLKPVLSRERADRDIEKATAHYLTEAGPEVALDFIDALQEAYRLISRHPASGSPRYGHELGLPGLRFTALKRHPHLIFYVEREDHVDVWRVLQGERDIPEWLRE